MAADQPSAESGWCRGNGVAESSNKPAFVSLYNSPVAGKKYRAIFYNRFKEEIGSTDFGADGYRDFTLINDPDSPVYIENEEDRLDVRDRYIQRHKQSGTEDWNDPMTAGALSRFVLWEEPTLEASWRKYLKSFGLKSLPM